MVDLKYCIEKVSSLFLFWNQRWSQWTNSCIAARPPVDSHQKSPWQCIPHFINWKISVDGCSLCVGSIISTTYASGYSLKKAFILHIVKKWIESFAFDSTKRSRCKYVWLKYLLIPGILGSVVRDSEEMTLVLSFTLTDSS